jgi:tetratricopeptide (TPR) repeat protein
MYSIYVASAVTIIISFLFHLLGLSWVWIWMLGVIIAFASFSLINRRFAKQVEGVIQKANMELQSAQNLAQRGATGGKVSQIAMDKKTKNAIHILKQGFQYEKWQVGAATSLNAQIGMILFSQNIFQQKGQKGKLGEAIPYLEATLMKGLRAKLMQSIWHAWLRLAVCYFLVKKDKDRALEVMETVVGVVPKEGLAWSVYAWFYFKTNQNPKAIEVLVRGGKESADPQIKENLNLLQNGKKMKMSAYGNSWWGLGLEKAKHLTGQGQQQMGHPRMKGGRGMKRR